MYGGSRRGGGGGGRYTSYQRNSHSNAYSNNASYVAATAAPAPTFGFVPVRQQQQQQQRQQQQQQQQQQYQQRLPSYPQQLHGSPWQHAAHYPPQQTQRFATSAQDARAMHRPHDEVDRSQIIQWTMGTNAPLSNAAPSRSLPPYINKQSVQPQQLKPLPLNTESSVAAAAAAAPMVNEYAHYSPTSPVAQVTHAYNVSQQHMRSAAASNERRLTQRFRKIRKHDRKDHVQYAAELVFATDTFRNDPTMRAWDGGCGAGGIVFWAYDAGVHLLIGTDVSEPRIDEARKMATGLALEQADGRVRELRATAPEAMKRFYQHSPTMVTSLTVADSFLDKTHSNTRCWGPFHIHTYFDSLHYAASSLEHLEAQFAFCEATSVEGSILLIQTLDDARLKRLLTDRMLELAPPLIARWSSSVADAPSPQQIERERALLDKMAWPTDLQVSNSLCTIEWPALVSLTEWKTGMPYHFSFTGSMTRAKEYVICRDDVIQLATKHGYKRVADYNVLDHIDQAIGGEWVALGSKKLNHDERQTLGLYHTYLFSRVLSDATEDTGMSD